MYFVEGDSSLSVAVISGTVVGIVVMVVVLVVIVISVAIFMCFRHKVKKIKLETLGR